MISSPTPSLELEWDKTVILHLRREGGQLYGEARQRIASRVHHYN